MGNYLNSRSNSFFTCANCGAEVKRGARACPDCGADERTGLYGTEEDSLPEDAANFDYDDFIKKEFGGGLRPAGISRLWWMVGALLVLAFVAWLLRGVL